MFAGGKQEARRCVERITSQYSCRRGLLLLCSVAFCFHAVPSSGGENRVMQNMCFFLLSTIFVCVCVVFF